MNRVWAIAQGALLGSAIGAWTGLLDAGIRYAWPQVAISPSALPAIVALHAATWLLLGSFVALSLIGVPSARRNRWNAGLLVGCSSFVLGGGLVNIFALPGLLDPRSLLFDLGWLLACGLGVVVLVRRLRNVSERGYVSWAFVAIAGAALLSFVVAHSDGRGRADPRVAAGTESDILVVLLDALRADHLSCYGYHRSTTPHIDAIAHEGVLFERAYAPSSWTKPSVATLFTGTHPSTHGNHRIVSRLPEGLVTLPELLREAGYRTGVFAENSFVSTLFGYGRGADRIVSNEADVPSQTTLGHLIHQLAVRMKPAQWCLTAARWFNGLDPLQTGRMGGGLDLPSAFFAWLDGLRPDEHFFAYVHLMKPHAPYVCPAPYDGTFGEPSPEGGDSPVQPPHVDGIHPFAEIPRLDAQTQKRLLDNYDERLLYGDALVGRLVSGLIERGRWADLRVVILSDHGEEFGEHGLYDHGHSLQEPAVRVPLILRAPGRLREGTREPEPVRLLDVAPTVLHLANVEPHPQHDGRSLLGQVAESPPRPVLLELEHGPGFWSRGLVVDDHKLVETRSGAKSALRLYDLAQDPEERSDVGVAGQDPLSRMLRDLDALQQAAAVRRGPGGEAVLDPETEERLRALGYIR